MAITSNAILKFLKSRAFCVFAGILNRLPRLSDDDHRGVFRCFSFSKNLWPTLYCLLRNNLWYLVRVAAVG